MTSLLFFWTVLQHTPSWVWAVFALLVLLGLKQSRPSQVGPTRATLLPVAMLLLALAGVLGAFASAAALLAWAAATVAVATLRAEPAARGLRALGLDEASLAPERVVPLPVWPPREFPR